MSILLSGCHLLSPRDDPTRFYLLSGPAVVPEDRVVPGVHQWKLGLSPIELPEYLRTKSMVVRTGQNELQYREYDRWAEPLDRGISRLLKETLSSARNVETVQLNSHGGAGSDIEVRLRVLACEGVAHDRSGASIQFVARWEVRWVGTNLATIPSGGFTSGPVNWDGRNYDLLAERLSTAIVAAGVSLANELPGSDGARPRANK